MDIGSMGYVGLSQYWKIKWKTEWKTRRKMKWKRRFYSRFRTLELEGVGELLQYSEHTHRTATAVLWVLGSLVLQGE